MKRIIGDELALTVRALALGTALLLGGLATGCSTESGGQSTPSAEMQRNRLKIAEAMFQERCKTAGEKIYRTVENVERIFLMKIRPERDNFSDQFALDDPYGRDFGGAAYIKSFLRGFFAANYRTPEVPRPNTPPHLGYQYVEAIDPQDGKRYQYRGRIEEPWKYDKSFLKGYSRFVIDKTLASDLSPQFGITYDDISTHEEREYWIAGSSLKVIDLKTNEIMAERIGYMIDPGQGNTSGGRSPWLLAADHACPSFSSRHGFASQPLQTENFIEKILKPSKAK